MARLAPVRSWQRDLDSAAQAHGLAAGTWRARWVSAKAAATLPNREAVCGSLWRRSAKPAPSLRRGAAYPRRVGEVGRLHFAPCRRASGRSRFGGLLLPSLHRLALGCGARGRCNPASRPGLTSPSPPGRGALLAGRLADRVEDAARRSPTCAQTQYYRVACRELGKAHIRHVADCLVGAGVHYAASIPSGRGRLEPPSPGSPTTGTETGTRRAFRRRGGGCTVRLKRSCRVARARPTRPA